jgi:metal-responsive CopG/Arc/MetJ family transcriptional regulator
VRLCEEHHRSRVSRHVEERHADASVVFSASIHRHLTHLKRLPAMIVHGANKEAVEELKM